VNLSDNKIEFIRNLQHCYSLSLINLGYNRLSDLSEISLYLGNIKTLILKNNAIRTCFGIEVCIRLLSLRIT
jgi:Leucine-rich repeat (LRR) protein